MFNHLLIVIALSAFSIVSTVAVTPTDVHPVPLETAVLHKDVVAHQGGNDDKDVAAFNAQAAAVVIPEHDTHAPVINDWFAVDGDSNGWQPVVVLFSIIGLIMFFVARKSDSAK